MDIEDKRQAESILRDLCLGKQVVGARWYASNFFIFFLNGRHDSYECWNLSTVAAPDSHDWLIVAAPGSEVAVFAPKSQVLVPHPPLGARQLYVWGTA